MVKGRQEAAALMVVVWTELGRGGQGAHTCGVNWKGSRVGREEMWQLYLGLQEV